MKWLAAFGLGALLAGIAAVKWSAPADPPEAGCPDELDDYGDCEFPTWLEDTL